MTFRATNDFLVGMLAGYENRLCLAAAQRSFSRRGMDHGHLPGMEAVAGPALRDRSGLFDPSAQWRRGKRERLFPWLPHARHRGLDRQLQGHFAVGRSRFSRCWKRSEPISTASGPRKAIATSRPGRASVGAKWLYRSQWGDLSVIPYFGLYGDYYFSKDDATTALLTPSLDGASLRATSGLTVAMASGAQIAVGGELGGIGSGSFDLWSARARMAMPF